MPISKPHVRSNSTLRKELVEENSVLREENKQLRDQINTLVSRTDAIEQTIKVAARRIAVPVS